MFSYQRKEMTKNMGCSIVVACGKVCNAFEITKRRVLQLL
jgi:hypothetical protein